MSAPIDNETVGEHNSVTRPKPTLLNLPIELRSKILTHLLTSTEDSVSLPPLDYARLPKLEPGLNVQILATCRQLRSEGEEILYKENTFKVESLTRPFSSRHTGFTPVSAANLNKIRHVEIGVEELPVHFPIGYFSQITKCVGLVNLIRYWPAKARHPMLPDLRSIQCILDTGELSRTVAANQIGFLPAFIGEYLLDESTTERFVGDDFNNLLTKIDDQLFLYNAVVIARTIRRRGLRFTRMHRARRDGKSGKLDEQSILLCTDPLQALRPIVAVWEAMGIKVAYEIQVNCAMGLVARVT